MGWEELNEVQERYAGFFDRRNRSIRERRWPPYRVDGLAWELNNQDQVEIVTQTNQTITVDRDHYIVHNNSLYVDGSILQIIGALSGAGVFLLLAYPHPMMKTQASVVMVG